jgi:dihydroorotate dehydrogenase
LIYPILFKLVLRRLDPERAHGIVSRVLRGISACTPLRRTIHRLLAHQSPSLRVKALGLDFPSPLGVAAGMDKQATWHEGLCALGFGFVEVGTVTALPQAGNPKPRVFRMTADRALINRMGFPNPGAVAVGRQLQRARDRTSLLGANIGKSKLAPVELAQEDYRRSVHELARACDYLVVNVSSPNTPGLRDLQKVDSLRVIVNTVRGELAALGSSVPLLVKIAPDLSDEQLSEIAELALELKLDGIVAVNTTLERGGLIHSREQASTIDGGGVSGAPLKRRALEVLQRLHACVGGQMTLISVGGIETPQDAWERILAGATLVQAYTAIIYNGPSWPGRMNRELARLVRLQGYSSIEEAVGMGASQVLGELSSGAGAHPDTGMRIDVA